jgi:hypothetical protein
MTKTLIILFFILTNFSFAQQQNCDCTVKVSKGELGLKLFTNGVTKELEVPKNYQPLLPKAGQTFAKHQVIKDTAALWFIKSGSDQTILKTKKLATTFLVTLQFKNSDSIPVFSEPDKKSKILTYVKSESKLAAGQNEYWFAGCKKDFVKIVLMNYAMKTGWVPTSFTEK